MKSTISTRLLMIVVWFVCSLMSTSLQAAERGTPEEAVALVKKAVAMMKSDGTQKVIGEINRGMFVDRDLYVTVIDFGGKSLANVNPRLVGVDVLNLKDADGKPFIRNAIESVKKNGKGWTDFKWPNPVNKQLESKSSYSERFENFMISCGVYKN